jgi:ABC-type Fe3+-hydroxamate transport system substrate-binding protein
MTLLSGCRESSVIEQIIYDQNAKDVDPSDEHYLIKHTEDSATPDIELPPTDTADTEKRKQTPPVPATEGADKNNAATPASVPDTTDTETESDKEPVPGPEDSTQTGDVPSGGPDTAGPSDEEDSREVEDANGVKVALPEKVNRVVAPGEAAFIIQMLGGKGILSGTSGNVASNALGATVFSSEDISAAQQLWAGDGASPMSGANFDALLATPPDVVVMVSGDDSFSAAQIATLKENAIPLVTLPKPNTHTNIVRAVKIAGKMIGDRSAEPGGVDAAALAEAYETYANDLLDRVQNLAGGRFTWNSFDFNNDVALNGRKKYTGQKTENGSYTLFLSEWRSAQFSIAGSDIDESGVAIAPLGYSSSPLSYYMSAAGVLNNAARFTNTTYASVAALPINLNTSGVSLSDGALPVYPDKAESMGLVRDGGTIDVGIGQDSFRSVVVDSASIKNKLLSSALWKPYGQKTIGNVKNYYYKDYPIISYIRGDYEIYVNPGGVTNWTGGSPESVLEAIWASWRLHGKSSESDVRAEIKKFYTTFYRYELSDAQVSAILSGK